ncbi:MAG: asparagine synthase (glutamine-hydrolyzing) [Chitinophagales bacterium]|nr:asparagine synthase (glutamine-hydrolyzing) [Chitinophagales bacterium]
MCGIAGFINLKGVQNLELSGALEDAAQALNQRGPDCQSTYHPKPALGFAHARLSVIDTSESANQPMSACDNRYTIVFNGEIYNYQELKERLEKEKQEVFHTVSDTEVILRMFHHYGKSCVHSFNGFFAFAIYDKEKDETFIARDRLGIKPLLYTQTKDAFLFASEMKALLKFGIQKDLDFVSLQQYFQFNYIPNPATVFKGVFKLKPGHYVTIDALGSVKEDRYYSIPFTKKYANLSYEKAQSELVHHLDKAVQRRLVSDVPLGSFLSGGIDSSVIATLAARHQANLNTFSIGFADNPYFDETQYANLVAKKIKSNHTVFSLSNADLYENLHDILDYIDEPFADSSALPVYILSKKTRQHVTVALSGDGADELFGGYNKHQAEYLVQQDNLLNTLVSVGGPLWDKLPKSRHSKLGNLFRQLDRFAQGKKLDTPERYWRWCSFSPESYAKKLLKTDLGKSQGEFLSRKVDILKHFNLANDINETLYTDMHLVLVNDMLTKVDLMSMANSLEVRVPFLDHELVNFAFQLPGEFKVSKKGRKRIVKDAFRRMLPPELYSRNKMGFEVPLLQWFRSDLKALIVDDLLADDFIEEQNIFNIDTIRDLKKQLFSSNPGDIHAQIWALIVFQTWYKKYMV